MYVYTARAVEEQMEGEVARFDAETERDIAEWVPPERAEEYRTRRHKSLARFFAGTADDAARARVALAEAGTSLARQINESVERMGRRRP